MCGVQDMLSSYWGMPMLSTSGERCNWQKVNLERLKLMEYQGEDRHPAHYLARLGEAPVNQAS